jgi:L-threonylcarbamoyladenylate synthase
MRYSLLTPSEAAERLRIGQIIAYPTEAVFGLGCDPANESAVMRLLSLKQRPVTAGLIVIASRFEQFEGWVEPVPPEAMARASATWPGPVTWLFPRGPRAPDWVTGQHETLAIRVTAHPPCFDLCEAFGGPLVSTSANPHSAAPARSAGQVETYFGSFIAGIMEGPLGGGMRPSEIRDVLTGEIVREG